MGQALDASDYIYQGLWINWTKGGLLGLTLTLSPTRATLLTNLIALFVTIAGGQAWTIVRFTLHQIRTCTNIYTFSTRYNKEQVVLRNSTSAVAAAQLLFYLGWKSRSHRAVQGPNPSTTPVVTLAAFTAVFFVVAGAFSNILTDAGSAVLSRSPHCGFFNQTYADLVWEIDLSSPETFDLFDESITKRSHSVELSLQYAQSCYLMQGTGSSNCDTFKRSSLDVKAFESEECPFKLKMCKSSTVVFDTGPLDSHTDLGINAREEDRITYRRLTNCSVLNDSDYSTGWINQTNSTEEQPALRIAYMSFGPDTLFSENVTYSFSNSEEFETEYAQQYSIPYKLGRDYAYARPGVSADEASGGSIEPIAEIWQDHADLHLLYLSYLGTYMSPVDDPWFAAHQITHPNTTVPFLQTTYGRDSPISTVGCTEQHQVCAASKCTPFLGFDQVNVHLTNNLLLTEAQNVTADRILSAATAANLLEILQFLSSSGTPFLAIDKTVQGRKKVVSLPLPDNHWVSELTYWQSISLAQLQRVVVEYGTGQISPQTKYLLPPKTDSQKWICQNLLIRSTAYTSFSILALVLVLVFGLGIVILSLTIEWLTSWLSRKFGRWQHAQKVWKDHDMLGEQSWKTQTSMSLPTGSEKSSVSCASNETLPVYFEGDSAEYLSENIRKLDRVSSQALSEEDCERLLAIARAYESRI